MTVAEDPSAVLLVRVWLEGEDRAFRARLSGIVGSGDAAAPEESSVAVVASAGDALMAVERWLADFLRTAGGATGT